MSINSPTSGDTQVVKAGAYGVEHIAGSPYYPIFDNLEGWTGAAVSAIQLNNSAETTFAVPIRTVGAVVGLHDGPAPDYTYLTHALYFSAGAMRVVESGVIVGSAFTFTNADTLAIRVTGGVVTYRKNGTTFYTSSVAPTGVARNVLAFLYAAGDSVWNLTVLPLTAPTAAGTVSASLQPLFGVAGSAQSACRVLLEPLDFVGGFMAAPVFNQIRAQFEPGSATLASEHVVRNYFVVNLEPLFGVGSDTAGLVQINAQFEPLVAYLEAGTAIVVTMSMGTLTAAIGFGGSQALLSLLLAAGLLSGRPTAYIALPVSIASNGKVSDAFTMDSLLQGLITGTLLIGGSTTARLALIATILANAIGTTTAAALQALQAIINARALIGGADRGFFGADAAVPLATWVANESNYATSRYEGFDFNSFAMIGGQYYGARADGIYLLDGNDDLGAHIHASIDYGNVRVAGGALARVSNAYVATSSTGRLFMRITARGQDGQKRAAIYEARNARDVMAMQRFDFAKGFRDQFFNFELYNGPGEDFDVSGLEFIPLRAERKV